MPGRFISIWFRHLVTDWLTIRQPALKGQPFVFAAPEHGRMVITAANATTQAQGIDTGAAVADARALVPCLQVFDEQPGRALQLLKAIGRWCIRYTPVAAIDAPDGLVLDISGCAHLWGGEAQYLKEIVSRLQHFGYDVQAALADTPGAARAVSRYGKHMTIVPPGGQMDAILSLPPVALRLEDKVLQRLQKLGLYKVNNFISMPRPALRRRFGQDILLKLDQALGFEEEVLTPVIPAEYYQERLPCLEPIVTATGIKIALERLLEGLCKQLQQNGKGLRTAVFKAYRVDGKMEQVQIGTNRATHHTGHLFKLFENKIPSITPASGIELFILEAPNFDDLAPAQESMWTGGCGLESVELAELVDRLANKIGAHNIHRYLPDQHYWPERSLRLISSLLEKATTMWRNDNPRPIQLLHKPEPIEVSAPIPDYPPMLFRYKGQLHRIKKADGPERIEREWWLEEGLHRDYYIVEDENGRRYWLFRSGHYAVDKPYSWFMHGFFA